MATKVCSSCGAEVPSVAKRCKDCFHDFDGRKGGVGWTGPIALLAAVAGMVSVAFLTLLWIVSQPQEQHTQVDQDARSIVWTRTFVSGTTSERMLFDEVQRLEYTMHASGGYEVAVISKDNTRRVVQISQGPLKGEAETYARVMGADLVVIDNTTGFGGKLK